MGQPVNFGDGFEDGEFLINPAWSGDKGQFSIIEQDGNNLLQLTSSGNDVSQLTVPSIRTEGSWEFFINLDFSPSGSNFAYVFLMSDTDDLENGSPSGYALKAGEPGSSDVFRIVRFDGGVEGATVLSGTTDLSSGGAFRVKVTRETGDWTLEVGKGYEGVLNREGGAQTDNTYTAASHFGIMLIYTPSRADKFFFDFKISLPPFTLTGAAANGSQVDITFNRACDQSSVQPGDFTIDNGLGAPGSVSFPSANVVRLDYGTALPSNKYSVSVSNVDDQNGETIALNTTAPFFVFDTFTDGDIIINEFLYDPPAGLAEYIELKNLTGKYMNLQNWQVGDETGTGSVSPDTLVLEADSFLVISADTTALFNTFGARAYVQMPGLASLNNSGDAVRVLTDKDTLVDSLTYTPGWGGEDIALERRSASTASTIQENWDTSPNAGGGTPGLPNRVKPDNLPPFLAEFEIAGNRTLNLAFSERVEEGSAENIANYSLSNGIGIAEAKAPGPDSVQLSLNAPLQNATHYQLTISGIEDVFGNTIAAVDTIFTYYEISQAEPGDVFVNEFMSAPPSGQTEYIELYNPTSKSFNVQGWTINDNTGSLKTIASSRVIFPPGKFIVIAPDSTLMNSFPGIHLLTMGTDFPSLNNSGDDIVLRRADGALLDSLRYASSWGGDRTALERRTTSIAATFRENWGDSPEHAGTPGGANAIVIDNSPPAFEALEVITASRLQLIFSESIKSAVATHPSNYTISPGRSIQLIAHNADTVSLFLGQDLQSGIRYEITVNNLEDIFGNLLDTATLTVEYLEFSTAQPGDIVINEILFDRSDNALPEFVEIYNRSDKNITLQGWELGDASRTAFIETGPTLEPDAYAVLTGSSDFAASSGNVFTLADFPSLNDSYDAVYLVSELGTTIDSLFYDETWGGEEDRSLERKDPDAASNDPSNWTPSGAGGGFTAGTANNRFAPDQASPQVIFSKLRPDGLIEVRFSEFIKITPELQFLLDGVELAVAEFNPSEGNTILINRLPSKLKRRQAPDLAIQNLPDVKGNITPSASIPVARMIMPGSVVINEIMYNPLGNTEDNRPDQSEYIELRNTRDVAVSMEGFFLHDAPDENGEIRSLAPVSSVSKWIPANGILLVHADTAAEFPKSRTALFFGLDGVNPVRIDRSSLSLASHGDAIYLSDSTGTTIDSVFYDESWQNPNILDNRGIALERIHPGGPGDDASNWSSSTHPKGGTPGSENSIYQTPGTRPGGIGISFEPNPFSPDGDGFEDNLFINYRLDEPGYLLKVRVFDRYGRHVRKLADSKPAGFEGSLIWDGLTDKGNKNRIGIYIVLFEAYNSNNGESRAFKEVVVLARRM